MEIIKEALMKWGEAMQLRMEDRTLFNSPVLEYWRVKKWSGKRSKSLIYGGASFRKAFEIFLGSHANEQPTQHGNDIHNRG